MLPLNNCIVVDNRCFGFARSLLLTNTDCFHSLNVVGWTTTQTGTTVAHTSLMALYLTAAVSSAPEIVVRIDSTILMAEYIDM